MTSFYGLCYYGLTLGQGGKSEVIYLYMIEKHVLSFLLDGERRYRAYYDRRTIRKMTP